MAKELSTKVQLLLPTFTSILDKASRESLSLMLKRANSVRVAKVASFTVSNVPVSELLTTEEIYELTNNIYYYVEDKLAGGTAGIVDDALLAKLQA